MAHAVKLTNIFGNTILRYNKLATLNISKFYLNKRTMCSALPQGRSELVERFLCIEQVDENLFRSKDLLAGRPRTTQVYGGLIIGQCLIAASKTVPEKAHAHSLHSYFIKTGNSEKPIIYYVDRVRDGRSFFTRNVKAVQDGVTIYSAMLSFATDMPESITHEDKMPDVPRPDELEETEELFRKILANPTSDVAQYQRERMKLWLEQTNTFFVKPTVPEVVTHRRGPEPKANLWVKVKGEFEDKEYLHMSAAGYISDFFLIGAALLPHQSAGFQAGMVVSLDHTMWFHTHNFKISDWMLYETWSNKAGASRALSFGHLWTQDGKLAISTAQESLVRAKL